MVIHTCPILLINIISNSDNTMSTGLLYKCRTCDEKPLSPHPKPTSVVFRWTIIDACRLMSSGCQQEPCLHSMSVPWNSQMLGGEMEEFLETQCIFKNEPCYACYLALKWPCGTKHHRVLVKVSVGVL